jgi:hypothetical protein
MTRDNHNRIRYLKIGGSTKRFKQLNDNKIRSDGHFYIWTVDNIQNAFNDFVYIISTRDVPLSVQALIFVH